MYMTATAWFLNTPCTCDATACAFCSGIACIEAQPHKNHVVCSVTDNALLHADLAISTALVSHQKAGELNATGLLSSGAVGRLGDLFQR